MNTKNTQNILNINLSSNICVPCGKKLNIKEEA